MNKIYMHIWINAKGEAAPEFDEGNPIDVMERLAKIVRRMNQSGCQYKRTISYDVENDLISREDWGVLCAL